MGIFTIIKPVMTEKSMLAASQKRGFTFEVAPEATKGQIAQAVEETFGVNVLRVRTVTTPGKIKRRGTKRLKVAQRKTKKAIVTLKKDQMIDMFEVQK